ncbi:glucans biosynthesis glucosyltransferase MdoH [Marinivivus vitaminiproducens]|uniref:glucans biosynthesis glucosyltransferase MdoH n=1 Tax=Marinivivus vitaminiproducens TaxID=3035935 RepID=UPI0027A276F8|nr:glucans biosynthesis glucosyltransferase MdoH [Geminicoccaceae bacterium SCSIO 64248]
MSPADRSAQPPSPCMPLRRTVFAALVLSTMAGLGAWFLRLFGADGLSWPETAMLALFLLTLPWTVIGLWNAVIGFVILITDRDPVRRVTPLIEPLPGVSLTARTAIVMPVFNESPERVFRHLRAVTDTLEDTEQADAFEIFLLSDTTDPAIAAEERARFALWKSGHVRPDALHYCQRPDNAGHKVGNLRSFCDAHGDHFAHMLVLDADSVMSGEAIVRLVRLMQANPRLGILQTLAVGLPALSPFARIFQFGMRQAMRPFTVGSAWWQGDSGPYWGHNALIRLEPYRAHCRLPVLPGRPPFGGEILSHDQVEAALMRAAGYEVRVLPVESGSFEENPPTLPDFIKRELRWCQGNLQYARLIAAPGLRPLGRLQLLLAMAMYLNPATWMLFLAIGVGSTIAAGSGLVAYEPVPRPAEGFFAGVTDAEGLALFLTMTALAFSPKIAGVIDILVRRARRQAYGGGVRIALSGLMDMVFSALIAPAIALAVTLFIVGLFFGRKLEWQPQARDGHRIGFAEASRVMAPQTLFGLAILTGLGLTSPQTLPWSAPVILGLLLATPVTTLSSRTRLGRPLARLGLFASPEEFRTPPELRLLALDVHPRVMQPLRPAPIDQPILLAATVAEGETVPPG